LQFSAADDVRCFNIRGIEEEIKEGEKKNAKKKKRGKTNDKKNYRLSRRAQNWRG